MDNATLEEILSHNPLRASVTPSQKNKQRWYGGNKPKEHTPAEFEKKVETAEESGAGVAPSEAKDISNDITATLEGETPTQRKQIQKTATNLLEDKPTDGDLTQEVAESSATGGKKRAGLLAKMLEYRKQMGLDSTALVPYESKLPAERGEPETGIVPTKQGERNVTPSDEYASYEVLPPETGVVPYSDKRPRPIAGGPVAPTTPPGLPARSAQAGGPVKPIGGGPVTPYTPPGGPVKPVGGGPVVPYEPPGGPQPFPVYKPKMPPIDRPRQDLPPAPPGQRVNIPGLGLFTSLLGYGLGGGELGGQGHASHTTYDAIANTLGEKAFAHEAAQNQAPKQEAMLREIDREIAETYQDLRQPDWKSFAEYAQQAPKDVSRTTIYNRWATIEHYRREVAKTKLEQLQRLRAQLLHSPSSSAQIVTSGKVPHNLIDEGLYDFNHRWYGSADIV